VTGLAALGIAQFTYYVGRSDGTHLYFVCVPLLVLLLNWLDRTLEAGDTVPDEFRRSVLAACSVAVSPNAAKALSGFATALSRKAESVFSRSKNRRSVVSDMVVLLRE
jgi:hypothetical protein